MADKQSKNRFWVGVLYIENMVPDWETKIGDLLQVPYAYCIHNADTDSKSEHRKDHVHMIIVFSNTTTYKHALSVFDELSADGVHAINKCERVINIRSKYEYLIHNTETCKKEGKTLYDESLRITGNNFDIGAYEQISLADKNRMRKELMESIKDNAFMNFMDFMDFVMDNYDDEYLEIIATYSGLFERMTKGNYQRWLFAQSKK